MSNATPVRDPLFVAALQKLLNEECLVHEQYIATIEKEQTAVTQLHSDEVAKLTTERAALLEAMNEAQERRKEFLKRFPDSENKKLSELLAVHCHPQDIKEIHPLVKKLKALLTTSKTLGNEMGQVTDFALTMINGTMSIIWSATQNITRAYGKTGVVKESYQSLKNDTLKQA